MVLLMHKTAQRQAFNSCNGVYLAVHLRVRHFTLFIGFAFMLWPLFLQAQLKNEDHTFFQLNQTEYITVNQQEYSGVEYSSFFGRWSHKHQRKSYDLGVDVGGIYTLSHATENYVYASDAYIVLKSQGAGVRSRHTIGVHKRDWSGFDTHWKLGLVQPFFEADRLHPIERGLAISSR